MIELEFINTNKKCTRLYTADVTVHTARCDILDRRCAGVNKERGNVTVNVDLDLNARKFSE